MTTHNKALVLLNKIKDHPILFNNFTLIGGTALSYYLNHRISNNLDFVSTNKLSQQNVDTFIQWLEDEGYKVEFIEQPESVKMDYSINCENIKEYQQDYMVNNQIRITFFCSTDISKILSNENIVASLDTLFVLKSLLITKRAKTRDYFDLLTLYAYNSTKFSPHNTIALIYKYEPIFCNQNEFLKNHLTIMSSNQDSEIICGYTFEEMQYSLMTEKLFKIF